jgi:acyl-coenzyme A thioesterase 13
MTLCLVRPLGTSTNEHAVDLGGSLAVASRGLYATGVSTDLNVTYLNSGGKVGDKLKAVVTCDKCALPLP